MLNYWIFILGVYHDTRKIQSVFPSPNPSIFSSLWWRE